MPFGKSPEAVELERLRASVLVIATKLKRLHACAASCIEGQPCIANEAHWCGRELTRLATPASAPTAANAAAEASDAAAHDGYSKSIG